MKVAQLVGSNRAYIEREIPHLERLLADTPEAALEGAGLVVLGHVGREDRGALLAGEARPVLDLAGVAELRGRPGYQGFCW